MKDFTHGMENMIVDKGFDAYKRTEKIKHFLYAGLFCLLLIALLCLIIYTIGCLHDIEDLQNQLQQLQTSYSSLKQNMLQ